MLQYNVFVKVLLFELNVLSTFCFHEEHCGAGKSLIFFIKI